MRSRGTGKKRKRARKPLQVTGHIDLPLLVGVVALVGFGLVMVLDTSPVWQETGDMLRFLKRQGAWALIGTTLLIGAAYTPYRVLQRIATPLLVLSLAGLVLVLVPGIGTRTYGARRWIRFAGVGIQPSEIAKLALVMYLAQAMAMKGEELKDLRTGLMPLLSTALAVMALVLMEPDFGMTVLIGGAVFTMVLLGGARKRHLAALASAAVPAMVLAVVMEPYRWRRMMVFLDPWRDPQGESWQITQSLVALGSGGWWGKGLGLGLQKLGYLPQASCDFVFSIVGEEMGLVGAVSVVAMFALVLWRGTRIAQAARDEFGHYLVMGITVMVSLQAVMHIGVVTACLPTTGISLPFVSLGGSSLVVNMLAIGFVLSVSRSGTVPRRKRR